MLRSTDAFRTALKRWQLYATAKALWKLMAYVQQPIRLQVALIRCKLSGVDNGLPIPPLRHRFATSWDSNPWGYLNRGVQTAESVSTTLARNDLSVAHLDAVLDFGCGAGRVLRNFKSHAHGNLYGTDCSPDLIAWCHRHLPFAEFQTNQLKPPLEWRSATFDLVYSVSVFTHLSESLALLWLKEIRRVLKPAGHLLLSTHGEQCLTSLDSHQKKLFYEEELVVINASASGRNECAVYHPFAYVARVFTKYFDLVEFSPGALPGTGNQDLYLFRKASG